MREQLEAEMKNTNLGQYVSQVVIPTEKIVTQRAGKKVIRSVLTSQAMCSWRLHCSAM